MEGMEDSNTFLGTVGHLAGKWLTRRQVEALEVRFSASSYLQVEYPDGEGSEQTSEVCLYPKTRQRHLQPVCVKYCEKN